MNQRIKKREKSKKSKVGSWKRSTKMDKSLARIHQRKKGENSNHLH